MQPRADRGRSGAGGGGNDDPFPRVAGGGAEELRRAGIPVEVGLLETEARQLNEAYLKDVNEGLPFVTLKMAMTLDGKIATTTGDSRWVTGEAARRACTGGAAVERVMVGIGTALRGRSLADGATARGRELRHGSWLTPARNSAKLPNREDADVRCRRWWPCGTRRRRDRAPRWRQPAPAC